MKRSLRISGHKDYVAVDLIDKDGKILSTPIYLRKDKPEIVMSYDQEKNRYYLTKVTFDGEKLICVSSLYGIEWESQLDELLDNKLFKQ